MILLNYASAGPVVEFGVGCSVAERWGWPGEESAWVPGRGLLYQVAKYEVELHAPPGVSTAREPRGPEDKRP